MLILLSIYFSLLIYSVKLSIIIITTYFYYCHLLSFLRVNDESSVSRKRLEVTVKFEWEYFTHKCTPIPMLIVTTSQATGVPTSEQKLLNKCLFVERKIDSWTKCPQIWCGTPSTKLYCQRVKWNKQNIILIFIYFFSKDAFQWQPPTYLPTWG